MRHFGDVTDAELAVLQVLWDQVTATIRQITNVLYPQGTTAHYATVQKLLERLEKKGCIERDRNAAIHLFCATITRDQLIGRRLRNMADQLCEGSLTPLLTHLVGADVLSGEERQQLRELVNRLNLELGGDYTSRSGSHDPSNYPFAHDAAAELWRDFGGLGDTLGDTTDQECKKAVCKQRSENVAPRCPPAEFRSDFLFIREPDPKKAGGEGVYGYEKMGRNSSAGLEL